jgi:hypothetical protein
LVNGKYGCFEFSLRPARIDDNRIRIAEHSRGDVVFEWWQAHKGRIVDTDNLDRLDATVR